MGDEWDESATSFSNGGQEPETSSWGGGGGKSSGTRSCYKCGEEGHMSRECPTGGGSDKPKGCFKCGEEGHMSRECPTGGGGCDRPKGCFKCGDEDHMARDCPTGGGDDRPKGCFKCKEEGHMARDCPNATEEDNLGPDGKPRPPIYVPTHLTDDQLFEEKVGVGINFDLYDNIKVSMSGEGDVPPRMNDFESSGLRPLLLENVTKSGYQRPTPIQRHCIPTIMAGRDVMACAQTGSGKTAAFVLPILHKLLEEGITASPNTCAEPSALIVAPTRELAVQIHNEARKFALHTVLRVCVCYGGASSRSQSTSLMAGCSVLVATPGRLADFIDKNFITMSKLKFLVLDEADRMLDMGFVGDIEKLMNNKDMPADRQTLMFSATFPEEIQLLAGKFLTNYVFYVVGMVGAANTDVSQEVLNVAKNEKRSTLMDKLNDIIQTSGNKALVFCETKRTADFLATYLSSQSMSSTSIHGDRFQSQREEALAQFKSGARKILVATAVAARGLDIKGVSHVINYDLPKEVDEYVHRIGRTGRVGNKGMAISFYEETSDGPIAKNLVKILEDAKQEAPDWLKSAAASSGHGLTYEGAGDFASTDIRGNVGGASAAFGGPAEEDEW